MTKLTALNLNTRAGGQCRTSNTHSNVCFLLITSLKTGTFQLSPAPKLPQPTLVPKNKTHVPNPLFCHHVLKCRLQLRDGHEVGCGQRFEKHRSRKGQDVGCAEEQVAVSLWWTLCRCPWPVARPEMWASCLEHWWRERFQLLSLRHQLLLCFTFKTSTLLFKKKLFHLAPWFQAEPHPKQSDSCLLYY